MKPKRALALFQKGLKDPYNALYYLLYGEEKNRVRYRVKLMMKLTGATHDEILYHYESFNIDEEYHFETPITNKKFHENLSSKINEGGGFGWYKGFICYGSHFKT